MPVGLDDGRGKDEQAHQEAVALPGVLLLAGIAPARPGAVGRIAGALLYLDEGSLLDQRPEEKAHKAAYGAEHHPAQES